ncbi:MAG: peroxiredoxin [Deltaproteobacteria bacterium]|nr:peroxiredoxin [Deltaproteobacteria bacterium]
MSPTVAHDLDEMDRARERGHESLVPALLAAVVALAVTLGIPASPLASPLLEPGDPFPVWSLRDHTGAVVTSQSLAGKTYLLWFYPKAQTPGCTTEGRGLRDRFEDFRARGIEILGVSFDDPEANAAFVKAEGFPFRLLSDTDKTLATQVGAVWVSLQPVPSRISYLVGPDGKVRKVFGDVTPATHAGDVLSGL